MGVNLGCLHYMSDVCSSSQITVMQHPLVSHWQWGQIWNLWIQKLELLLSELKDLLALAQCQHQTPNPLCGLATRGKWQIATLRGLQLHMSAYIRDCPNQNSGSEHPCTSGRFGSIVKLPTLQLAYSHSHTLCCQLFAFLFTNVARVRDMSESIPVMVVRDIYSSFYKLFSLVIGSVFVAQPFWMLFYSQLFIAEL